ncbi:hypothetical protein K3495_g11969 [Podosphaera aphanis]|nr:hypothetical protein K3495_g11969 [Podosphaera aphanis]
MRFSMSLLTVGTSVHAVNLYVASYTGTVTTLSLSETSDQKSTLSNIATVKSATPQSTWLEKHNNLLYVVNENFSGPNGSVIPFETSEKGKLSQFQEPVPTQPGPVASVVYNDGKALAVAHYGGHAVSNFAISDDGKLSPLQAFVYQTPPGPRKQQDSSHPHQVILHPAGNFLVVPDLGADLLRVFSIDSSSRLTEQKSFSVPPGSGPRHGAFLQTSDNASPKVFFFLITELSNTVSSYVVSPENNSLNFTLVTSADALNKPAPEGTASAELIISPDGKFVLTSVRNASILTIPNPSPNNNTEIQSDTLQSWAIDTNTGELTFKQIAPAGGRIPRHFALNKEGTLAAVGLQEDGRVVVYSRNVETGKLGDIMASADVEGEVTNILWDEQ